MDEFEEFEEFIEDFNPSILHRLQNLATENRMGNFFTVIFSVFEFCTLTKFSILQEHLDSLLRAPFQPKHLPKVKSILKI